MGVNNGSALVEEDEKQETSTDKKTISQLLGLKYGSHCREAEFADFSELQQMKLKLSLWQESIKGWFSHCKQLDHYLSLLCFLLTVVTLLLTLCLVQITSLFQSQSTLQETKLRDLTDRLDKLNQSYQLLFSQYPALNQYCPVSNTTTGERECGPCPAGWEPQEGRCLLFSQDRADWISSHYHCMTLGGAMVAVRTEDEQLFLWKTAQSLSHGDSYWLGLRSSDRGWQWSDGSVVGERPQFWAREPDETADSTELCGRLTPGDDYRRSWFTSRCSSQMRRICERRQAALQ